jgi:hypothetical protein
MCTINVEALAASRLVWFRSESQTVNNGGWMLVCEAKPTRHPARSPSAAVVTMYIG